MAWMELAHEREHRLEWQTEPGSEFGRDAHLCGVARVVAAALDMLLEYKDKPWTECEQAMERMRYVVLAYEPRWGDDADE